MLRPDTILFDEVIKWEPTPPSVFTNPGTYAFTAKLSGTWSCEEDECDHPICPTNIPPATIGTFTVYVASVTISPGSGWEKCAGSTNTFCATATPGGGTYSWSNGETNSCATHYVWDAASAGTNVVSVTYSVRNASCSVSSSSTGVVAAITTEPSGWVACVGTSNIFTAAGSPPGGTYGWSCGDSTSNTTECVFDCTMGGANVVTVSYSYGGTTCSASTTGTVDTTAGPWLSIPDEPIQDECGNTISIQFEGDPPVYHVLFNGEPVSTCVYNCGWNYFWYRKTSDGGQFHSIWHLTRDRLVTGCDEGTIGKNDWTVWKYDALCHEAEDPICREGIWTDESWGDPRSSPNGETVGQTSACE